MDDEDSLKQPLPLVDNDVGRLTTYELLLRQSRKMGEAATRTYDVTKEFLKQDVSTLRPDQLLTPVRINRTSKVPSKDNLQKIVSQSREVLAEGKTVILPVNLFPDTVIVDRTKVTIIKKSFFWSAQVISIRIEDVLNVSTSVGPFFGSLTISSRVMNSTDHFEITHFWRNDAIRLKCIIQGYMIAQHNNIETSHLTKEELIETLEELGRDSN